MEEPGGPRPTVEELQSLTVVKLRQRLAQYGIPQSGTKGPAFRQFTAFVYSIQNNNINIIFKIAVIKVSELLSLTLLLIK